MFYAGKENQVPFDINHDFNGLNDLYFQLINNDPLLFNYSDLPLSGDQQIFYFENRINAETFNQMQQSTYVSKDDIVAAKMKKFNIQLPESTQSVEIRGSENESIIKEIFDNDAEPANYQVNLTQQNDGMHELWINNELQEKFFCSSGFSPNCFGVVHFNIKEIVANYGKGFDYKLQLNARSVYWQYQVIVPLTRKIEVIEMKVSGINGENYEDPEEQQIVGGQTAQVFISPSPLQLQYSLETNPLLQLTYTNPFSNGNKQMEIKLPNPGAEELKRNNQVGDDDSFLVTTIIYV